MSIWEDCTPKTNTQHANIAFPPGSTLSVGAHAHTRALHDASMETPLYSRDDKMAYQQQQQQMYASPSQQQEQHLPVQWTPVDQEIIEDLLLVEPIAAYETPMAASGQYAHMHMYPQQHLSPASTTISDTNSDGVAVHPHARRAPQQQIELMAQGLSPGAMGFDGTDDVRKAKHREVQRRFMLRKKVLWRTLRYATNNNCLFCVCMVTDTSVFVLLMMFDTYLICAGANQAHEATGDGARGEVQGTQALV